MRLSAARGALRASAGRLALLCLAVFSLTGCGGDGAGAGNGAAEETRAVATLSGTVTYRERMALPINAVITVRLNDISAQDVPAVLLAETSVSAQGQSVPIPWTLDYDPVRVRDGLTYAVRAEIRGVGGELLWTTDTVHPVLTNGAPKDGVEILVRRTAD